MEKPVAWTGTPSIRGSTEVVRMILLTFFLVGLQFTWGIEMTYGTPYLLSLGLPKSTTSLVWIAGPLSGMIMQPLVGAYADRSTSPHGRRRPYMIVGSIITGFGLLLLGWTSEVVGLFLPDSDMKKNLTILVAVVTIYSLDFSVNAVQACGRSLIVDTLPTEKQQDGSAWAARMSAFGHVIGYWIGTWDLVQLMGPIGGDNQFKKMCFISASALWITVGITCWAVTERIRVASTDETTSARDILGGLMTRMFNLPERIKGICHVQFLNWVGWFPFLFYSSTFVGEIYYHHEHKSSESHDALANVGRLGSHALVIFSLITFFASVALPYLVRSPEANSATYTPRPPAFLSQPLQDFVIKAARNKPDLTSSWMISNLIFAVITATAPWITTLRSAITLVAACGIPWAISCWAPFGLMGLEINRLGERESSGRHPPEAKGSVELDLGAGAGEGLQHRRMMSDSLLHLAHGDHGAHQGGSGSGELAGIYLGVLNVYCTLGQFVGTAVSWVVFSMLDPTKNEAGAGGHGGGGHHWVAKKGDAPNAIAVCLFIGAVCSVASSEAARRLRQLEQ